MRTRPSSIGSDSFSLTCFIRSHGHSNCRSDCSQLTRLYVLGQSNENYKKLPRFCRKKSISPQGISDAATTLPHSHPAPASEVAKELCGAVESGGGRKRGKGRMTKLRQSEWQNLGHCRVRPSASDRTSIRTAVDQGRTRRGDGRARARARAGTGAGG